MAQEAIIEDRVASVEDRHVESDALVVCKGCEHLVPRTMMCLYCGAAILFRKPRQAEE